jgi:sulfate transport system permease protein
MINFFSGQRTVAVEEHETVIATTPSVMPLIHRDPWYVRIPLICTAVLFLGVLVIGPLVNVFVQAFSMGFQVAWDALTDAATLSAIKLTLMATTLAVLANLTFGLAAAWALTRYRFRGKAFLNSLIDLPFAVSPVVAGLLFVLLFGTYGYCGPWLAQWKIEIIFAVPGIVLVTTFVTVPFIARELTPVLQAAGTDEEEAARTLGAKRWQVFWYVVLPNIRWGLLYGVILCTARAMGEFGAVSVVSGKMTGQTDTLPLHVEKLYQGLGPTATASSFAVAALLASLALVTLALKVFLERKTRQVQAEAVKQEVLP